MKKIIFAAFVALLFVSASAQNINNEPYVEVRGVAKTKVDPNRALIEIILSQADSKGKLSMKELDTQLATALKQAGVDIEKQLVLTNQSSDAQKQKKTYQFKTYNLTVTSAEEVQAVFDAFKQNNVQNAQLARIWNNDLEEINNNLKKEAVQNAKAEASILAQAVGQQIGKALMITCYSYGNDGIYMNMPLRSKAIGLSEDAQQEMPNVDFRKIDVEQSVNIRFELK